MLGQPTHSPRPITDESYEEQEIESRSSTEKKKKKKTRRIEEMLEVSRNADVRWQLGGFAIAVLFFHGSEYVLAASFHGPANVSLDSLLISKQYVLAMCCALLEYVVEIFLYPEVKELWWLSITGLVMVVVGEFIRKAAVITAGPAFTHKIRMYHEDRHELVTHGIYRFVRHPGYCGFFIWSVGTQVILCNPICIIAFAFVTWRFFSRRILYEEFFLRQFFGSQYEEYAQQVRSGLPLIK